MAGDQSHEHALPSQVSEPTQNQNSPLTSLPAELRNTIFALSFQDHISHYSIEYSTRRTKRAGRATANTPTEVVEKKVKATEPGLIRACKQTHKEALAVFYANAKFQFDNTQCLEDWARKVGWQRLELVRCLLMSEKPFENDEYTRPLRIDVIALAEIRRDIGLTSVVDVWFKTGPFHDATIGLDFCLWSQRPSRDSRKTNTYLVLRDHPQRTQLIDLRRTVYPARAYPDLPSWLIPIDTALLHDASWSRGDLRTFWAAL